MAKFHINPGTGRVNICRAEKKACPISPATEHHSSKEAAHSARENSLTEELGAFTAVSKNSEDVFDNSPVDPQRERAYDAVYEYGLIDYRTDDARIERVARTVRVPKEVLQKATFEAFDNHKKDVELAQNKYDSLVKSIVERTPENLKKGAIVAVQYDSETVRLMRIDNVRDGKLYGRTVQDGMLYEGVYMEDVNVKQVLRPTLENA